MQHLHDVSVNLLALQDLSKTFYWQLWIGIVTSCLLWMSTSSIKWYFTLRRDEVITFWWWAYKIQHDNLHTSLQFLRVIMWADCKTKENHVKKSKVIRTAHQISFTDRNWTFFCFKASYKWHFQSRALAPMPPWSMSAAVHAVTAHCFYFHFLTVTASPPITWLQPVNKPHY